MQSKKMGWEMKDSNKHLISLPFAPDYVMYHAYKFEMCSLCEEEIKIDPKFDNSKCPHCKKLTKCCMGHYGGR